jgi:hypothetical protein
MPHVNIWIRKADEKVWESIKNKPEAIHNMIVSYSKPLQASLEQKTTIIPSKAIKHVTRTSSGSNVCKQHGVSKSICAMMKHK